MSFRAAGDSALKVASRAYEEIVYHPARRAYISRLFVEVADIINADDRAIYAETFNHREHKMYARELMGHPYSHSQKEEHQARQIDITYIDPDIQPFISLRAISIPGSGAVFEAKENGFYRPLVLSEGKVAIGCAQMTLSDSVQEEMLAWLEEQVRDNYRRLNPSLATLTR